MTSSRPPSVLVTHYLNKKSHTPPITCSISVQTSIIKAPSFSITCMTKHKLRKNIYSFPSLSLHIFRFPHFRFTCFISVRLSLAFFMFFFDVSKRKRYIEVYLIWVTCIISKQGSIILNTVYLDDQMFQDVCLGTEQLIYSMLKCKAILV